MSDLLSPLRRTERFLAVRLLALERLLPPDGQHPELWPEYLDTVNAFTRVRAQLARPHPITDDLGRRRPPGRIG